MTDDIAIRVENLGKMYRIYDKPADRLKQLLWGRYMEKGYGREFWALKDFSCTVRRGEMVGVIGRNGSGKSTLLQIMAGTLEATAGRAEAYGRISALLELGSGFNPEFSGRDNVFIAGAIQGINADEMQRRYDEIVSFSGIGEYINQPVKTYSSGMTVRIAFAVACNIDPDILIIDEALAVGDLIFQQKCHQKFKEIRERGATVLYVSHDLSSVIQYCDRAMLLERGSVIGSGKPIAVVDQFKKICSQLAPPTSNRITNKNVLEIERKSAWMKDSPNAQIYGDGRAMIEGWEVLDSQGNQTLKISSGSEMTINLQVRFLDDCNAPIVGFGLRDFSGLDLAGSNTNYLNAPIGPMKINDIMRISFVFRVPFRGCPLNLCLACTEITPEGLAVLHRLYDVSVIEIVAETHFVGIVDVQPQILTKKITL